MGKLTSQIEMWGTRLKAVAALGRALKQYGRSLVVETQRWEGTFPLMRKRMKWGTQNDAWATRPGCEVLVWRPGFWICTPHPSARNAYGWGTQFFLGTSGYG
jgi:hypothetical protein